MKATPFYFLSLLLVTSAFGQDQMPDTTDASRYFPLQIGNIWEYRHVIDDPFDPEAGTRFERYTVVDIILSDTADFVILYEEFDDALLPLRTVTAHVAMDSTFSLVGDLLPGLLDLLRRLDADFYSSSLESWLVVEPGTSGPNAVFDSSTVTKRFETYSYVLEVARDIGIVAAGPFCEPCGSLTRTRNYNLRFASIDGQVFGARVASTNPNHMTSRTALNVFPNPTTRTLNIQTSPRDKVLLYDILGRLVREYSADSQGRVHTIVDGLSKGTYLVRSANQSSLVVIH